MYSDEKAKGKKPESERARELRKIIEDIALNVRILEGQKRNAEKELADELAEFKPGDKVWHRKKKAIIDYYIWNFGEVRYFVKYIKKDGKPGAVSHDCWGMLTRRD